MNDQALHGIAIYNPDLLSRDELKKYFVARRPVLDRLIKDLRREKASETPQHRLIIGARGMGKSTLLRRFAYAIEDDAKLSKQWLPLCFPEEQYNITRLSDLWLNCLDALGDALEQQGFANQAQALDDLSAALPIDEETRARQALRLLKEQAHKLNKRLILLIDNLDIVLARLKDAHWSIRDVMSEKGGMILMGTSAHAIEATYEYNAAFYDFFKIDELKGLSEEEMRSVLFNLADISDNEIVKTILKKDNARIKTLHTLTGGNPRTTVLLYGVISQGLDGDVRSDLEKLLDHCTPLYKARFEELSVQNQQIVDALAVHWDPIRAGDLAGLLRLQVNAVSSQLNRLVQQGIVEKVQYPGKKIGFQIAERFFNIWYLMRASRRVRRRLIWLVHFLRMFYNSEELSSHARLHLDKNMPQDSSLRLRYAEYGFALAQALEEKSLCQALESTSIHSMLDDNKLRGEFAKLVDLEGDDAPLKTKTERIQILNQAREALQDDTIDWSNVPKTRFTELFLGSSALSPRQKLAAAAFLPHAKQNALRILYPPLVAALEVFTEITENEQMARLMIQAIAQGDMESAEDFEGANAASYRFNAPFLPLFALLNRLRKEPSIGNASLLHDVLRTMQNPADNMTPLLTSAWIILAGSYALDLHDPEKALNILRQPATFGTKNPQLLTAIGVLLRRLGQPEEAREALRKALELSPDMASPLCELAAIEFEYFDKKEAESLADKAISLNICEVELLKTLSRLLLALKRPIEALSLMNKALDLDPNNVSVLELLAVAYLGLKEDNQAKETWERVIRIDPSHKLAHYFFAVNAVSQGNWSAAKEHVAIYIKAFKESDWETLLSLAELSVRKGYSMNLITSLQTSGKKESLRPLIEAIKAIESGSEEYLLTIAPEVRKPALELFERLSPDLGEDGR